MKEYVGGSHIFFVGECVIHHCVFTIAMVVLLLIFIYFINIVKTCEYTFPMCLKANSLFMVVN